MSQALIYQTSCLPSEKEEGLILELWMLPKPPLVPLVWEATMAIAKPSPYPGLRTVGRWGQDQLPGQATEMDPQHHHPGAWPQ